jgi:hypothetical protein
MQDKPFHYDPADFPDPHKNPDFDQSLVDSMLELTPGQRLERHERFRQFFEVAREARIKLYGYDPAVPPTSA